MPEENLYKRERELGEQIAKLSQYDRELRAIQERLDLLTASEQSGIPLTSSQQQERAALLLSQEATLGALQEDFPGIPDTPSGIEQALSERESEAYAVQVELDEQERQGLIRLPEHVYNALFPSQAPKPEKYLDDELDAARQQLKATLPELAAYEMKLRGMESTLGSLRYRANSNIPLSAGELEQYRELPNQLRETRKAFREEYPGVPATVNGIQKETQRYKNLIWDIDSYFKGRIQLEQLQQRLEEQGIKLLGQQTDLQQPGHHERPQEERKSGLAERFRQAEEAHRQQEHQTQEYDHGR